MVFLFGKGQLSTARLRMPTRRYTEGIRRREDLPGAFGSSHLPQWCSVVLLLFGSLSVGELLAITCVRCSSSRDSARVQYGAQLLQGVPGPDELRARGVQCSS